MALTGSSSRVRMRKAGCRAGRPVGCKALGTPEAFYQFGSAWPAIPAAVSSAPPTAFGKKRFLVDICGEKVSADAGPEAEAQPLRPTASRDRFNSVSVSAKARRLHRPRWGGPKHAIALGKGTTSTRL